LDPRNYQATSGLAFAYFFLGNYEEGLKCATDTLRHHPDHLPSLRAAIACHARSSNIEAAQKLWQQLALLSPFERVSGTRGRAAFRDQDRVKLDEAYRLVGMPE
jgi:tetratricopeptide (TPR) repeat protein